MKSGILKVSAREQLQRAAHSYRAALISMLPNDHGFIEIALKSRMLLKKAGKLHIGVEKSTKFCYKYFEEVMSRLRL